jgi:hypothetical protein
MDGPRAMPPGPDDQPGSIPTWQVLEEEFLALHGGLPPQYRKRRQELLADTANDPVARARELEALVARMIHALPNREARVALCLSGGGIRSATFGLGLLQGLAREGHLARFDYLSTVSGGGYIGGWLSAWIHRHRRGRAGVFAELAGEPSGPESRPPATSDLDAFLAPEPPPVYHLRQFSNYLSPRPGILSADTWTLVATYLRNLAVNWIAIIPVLLAILMLPRVYLALVRHPPASAADAAIVFLASLLCSLVAVWYANIPGEQESDGRPRPWRPEQRSAIRWCVVPIAAGACFGSVAVAWFLDSPSLREAAQAAYLGAVGPRGAGLGGAAPVYGAIAFGSVHVIGLLAAQPWRRRGNWWGLLASLLSVGLGWSAGWLVGRAGGAVGGHDALRYAVIGPPLFLVPYLAGGTAYVLALAKLRDRLRDEQLEWIGRVFGWLLIVAVGWLALASLVLYGPVGLQAAPVLLSSLGGASVLTSVLLGKSGLTGGGPARKHSGAGALTVLTGAVAPVAAASIAVLLSLLTTRLLGPWTDPMRPEAEQLQVPQLLWLGNHAYTGPGQHLAVLRDAGLGTVLVALLLLAGLGLVAGLTVAINRFSLHAIYRSRLIRAYLGASRRVRFPNRFTGFDAEDNLYLGELWQIPLSPEAILDPDGLLEALFAPEGPLQQAVATAVGPGLPAKPSLAEALQALNRLIDGRDVEGRVRLMDGGRRELVDRLPPATRRVRDEALAATSNEGRSHHLSRLYNRLFVDHALQEYCRPRRVSRPMPVINIALNVTKDPGLAWQDRKALPFTVSPLHAGSGAREIGYRRTDFLHAAGERPYGGEDRGMSLGTAIAISGAAASPNMGYHSSPVVTFLLSLFNVRLGWWSGNPRQRQSDRHPRLQPFESLKVPDWARSSPRGPGLYWMLREMFGLVDARSSYVYLSDGGHFENLGLYEMVRRRCKVIVVSDASADPDPNFGDLADSIRRIRTDFGIPITFDAPLPTPPEGDAAAAPVPAGAGGAVRLGRIGYGAVDKADEDLGWPSSVVRDGVLVYVKPGIWGRESADVRQYKLEHPEFPHESTADQWFSQQQFESYRALGEQITSDWDWSKVMPG